MENRDCAPGRCDFQQNVAKVARFWFKRLWPIYGLESRSKFRGSLTGKPLRGESWNGAIVDGEMECHKE